MFRRLIVFCLWCLFALSTYAKPQALFEHRVWYNDLGQPYIECFFRLYALSLATAETHRPDMAAQTAIITVIVSQNDKILRFAKSSLRNSVDKANSAVNDLLHLERLPLDTGKLLLEISLTDSVSGEQSNFNIPLHVKPLNGLGITMTHMIKVTPDSTLPDQYLRSGVHLRPHVSGFYDASENTISYYTEIYNTRAHFSGKENRFAVIASVIDRESGETVGMLRQIQRKQVANIVPVFGSFPLNQLGTGQYAILLEVRNPQNELLLEDQLTFERVQPIDMTSVTGTDVLSRSFIANIQDPDTMDFFVACLEPLANKRELMMIQNREAALPDMEDRKRFFLTFWLNRDSQKPDIAWQDYYHEVKAVEQAFSSQIRHGFETDRGRVYLQYGKPGSRTVRENEPSTYPYEIWQYDRIDMYGNVRFVFYSRDMVTNDYELLHSTLPGELKNPRWEIELTRRNTKVTDPDATSPDSHFGNRSRELFDNPR